MKKPQIDTDVGVSLAVSEARRSLGYTDNILFICVYLRTYAGTLYVVVLCLTHLI
jgi:hypothetical protein